MLEGQDFSPAARAPIALLRALPAGRLTKEYRKLKRMAKMFAAFDRNDMEMAVELLLAEMDAADGNSDVEPNGDEIDGGSAEDDFYPHERWLYGPGCPLSDGGCSTNSGAGDPAWAEWHTRGRHKTDATGAEQCRTLGFPNMAHEDAEEDDPREANGDELDGIGSEDDFMRHEADGPGCPISDRPEPSLGVMEEHSGHWPGNLGNSSDEEPWFVPVTLNGPTDGRHQVWA